MENKPEPGALSELFFPARTGKLREKLHSTRDNEAINLIYQVLTNFL